MNLLFTVCGRAGSKGAKGKNVRNFCGVPLVWYTLAAIALYRERYPGDRIETVLNTDSQELARLCAETPVSPLLLRRSPDLAGDSASKVSVIRDCLIRADKHWEIEFDLVIDLDITSPLRTVSDIRAAVEKKLARPDVDVVYSVVPSRRNPYFNMVREEGNFFVKAVSSSYTARQQAPDFYDMNASIYVYSPKALLEKDLSTFFNDQADAVIMADTGILDIDSNEDYELMQVIANYLYNQKIYFREIQERACSWVASNNVYIVEE